jgi:hypothetical protein
LKGGTDDSVKDVARSPLDPLELRDLFSALFFIASQYASIGHFKCKTNSITKFGASMTNSDVHGLLSKAAPVFHNWPSNYFSFLEWRRQNALPSKYPNGLRKEFREYKHALYRQMNSPCLDFMREGFEEYIATKWDGGYTSKITRLDTRVRHNKKFASMSEARKQLGASTEKVEELLKQGKLKAVIRHAKHSRMILIETDSIHELRRQHDDLLNKREAAKRLGITSRQVNILTRHDLLKERELYDSSGKLGFSITEIDALLNSLGTVVSAAKHRAYGEVINFSCTTAVLASRGVRLGDFLRSILDGQIRPCRKVGKGRGLKALHFDRRALVAYVKTVHARRVRDAFRIADAAEMLGIDINTALFLARTKLLVGHKKFIAHRRLLMIPKASITIFVETYVFARTLATDLNTSQSFLVNVLKDEGINPVSGRGIDGGPTHVFRRRDLHQVNLPAVVRARQESARIPTRRRTVSIDDAVRLLGTDKETILRLVVNDVLTPCGLDSKKKPATKAAFFRHRSLEKLKGRVERYMELISVRAAAKFFSRNAGFNFRYARNPQPQVICIPRDQKRYFRIEDIHRLIETEKGLLGSAAVADILKIGLSQILRLVTAGMLVPTSGPNIDGNAINLFCRPDVETFRKAREAFRRKRLREGGSLALGFRLAPREGPYSKRSHHV